MYSAFYFHKIFLHAAKMRFELVLYCRKLTTKFCCIKYKYKFTLHGINENKTAYGRSKKMVKMC